MSELAELYLVRELSDHLVMLSVGKIFFSSGI